MYEKIARHIGHNTEVAYYGNLNAEYLNQPSEIVNVAVECMDCHEVIVDAENPEWAWEDKPVHHWRASKKHPYGVERVE